ncbi:MAG: hypothetical protein WC461_00975 [Candidatus Paceibacterota bacterium]
MAIIVEEEKRRINWFPLILWISLSGIIIALAYYLFFAPTPLIEKVISQNTQTLKDLSGIKLNPEEVVNNPKFQILRQYINPVEAGMPGKSNPFLK